MIALEEGGLLRLAQNLVSEMDVLEIIRAMAKANVARQVGK